MPSDLRTDGRNELLLLHYLLCCIKHRRQHDDAVSGG